MLKFSLQKSWEFLNFLKSLEAVGLIMRIKKVTKRTSFVGCTVASTGEFLENRAMMTADPVGAIVAPESDYIGDAMLQDLVQSTTSTTNDDYFASFTTEPLTKREQRQEAREQRQEARDDIRGVARKMGAQPDLSGVSIVVTPVGDGTVTGTENIFQITVTSKRKVFVSGAQLDLSDAGADDISAFSLMGPGGFVIDTDDPNGEGSTNLTGSGYRFKGTAVFYVSATADPTAEGEMARVRVPELQLRRNRHFVQLSGFVGNNAVSQFYVGMGHTNPTNPTLSLTGTTLNQGQVGSVTVNLSSAATTTTNVTLTAGTGVVFTGNNSNTINVQLPAGQTTLQVPVMAVQTGNTNTVTVPITATSNIGNANTTVTVNGAVANNVSPDISGSLTLDQGQVNSNTIGVTLSGPPTGTVTVTVAPENPNVIAIEGPTSFTFNASNWNVKQYVTVRALNTGALISIGTNVIATLNGQTDSAPVTVNAVPHTGPQPTTFNVANFISLTGGFDLIGGSFAHTFANRSYVTMGDLNGDTNVETILSTSIHTTDANGTGIDAFQPYHFDTGEHGEFRLDGWTNEVIDIADNVQLIILRGGQVYHLSLGNGLTLNIQSNTYIVDPNGGVLQP